MSPLQLLVILFAVFAISRSYLRLREGKLSLGQCIFWTILWLGVVSLTFIPDAINIFADTLGIHRPIDVVVYFSIVLLFYLLFRAYVKINEVERELTELVTKTALKKR